MKIEEARLYLEHTSKDDFNLEEWQKENRYQAIQVILREIERLNNIINELEKDFKSYELEYLRETYQGSLADFIETELKRIQELKMGVNI